MSEIDFVELCEFLIEETSYKDQLALLEEEVQQKSQFQQNVEKIANNLNDILKEVEDASKSNYRKNQYNNIKARKPEIFGLRKLLKEYLNMGRQEAIKSLVGPKRQYVPYTEDEVDNFIHKKVTEGGIYESFGKLLQNQFPEDYFTNQK